MDHETNTCKGRVYEKVTNLTQHTYHVPNAVKVEAKKIISPLKKTTLHTTPSTNSVLGNATILVNELFTVYTVVVKNYYRRVAQKSQVSSKVFSIFAVSWMH